MCDLCCTLIAVRPRFVGETALCARCWDRYGQLFRQRVMGQDVRAYIVAYAHAVHCQDCMAHGPVSRDWYYCGSKLFHPGDAEPYLAMFCEQIQH